MRCPRVAIFDLDDTLAESFQPPAPEMVERLGKLLEIMPVAIMTAAGFPRIKDQFISHLEHSPHISQFYIFPNSTTECYMWENSTWNVAYSLGLSESDRETIRKAIRETIAESGVFEEHPIHAPEIIDRDAQIALATLGLEASYEEKRAWDPDQAKRKKLKAVLEKKIPQFEILMGGMTTIDITHKGINKAYGVNWFSTKLGIPTGEMLYVGDALYPGGNDEVVISTGIQTHEVSGPPETLTVIEELLRTCTTRH
ncbi:HAD family hydrolase [Candidatus Kaiserbacteria bacterium CG10_big_fil_rev_8_21_14_0_10_51_14]|uniref:phosphomannomutase n=1 Tax=Candidatus Kaiserbacteria bacterium CG10_big_fil_rev_8_21_14_0_10_51_14 TaxID=1974610 RepID=A0A2H0UC51_9BACT|nr:MAG: HAD family hydrolase [Candidatus Kaiserbacteria bacterium CG10_big_fil_rev_8_21_14_0_10_51_14]